MPENLNVDPESGSECIYGNTMATTNNINNNNRKQQTAPRVSSAGIKYYDIATQLLGKAGSDLEELFIAAARDGVYERIENFLHRNRSEYVVSIDVKDKKTGNTPLIWAAKRGHAKIVQLLLRHGADITLRNYESQTALEVASPSIRSILLESVERGTEASHQLLLQAAWQGDITVVSRLISQKKVLDINCLNADGFTPVMLATRDMQLFERLSVQMTRPYNPIEVVTELLSARADLHAVDGDGKTCLHHAAQSKANIAQSVVTTIISGGPNLEFKDKRCFAPIHCASLTGNADCITTLLEGGSEVNSRGFAGATPLHITSYNNHEKATEVLLEYGGNVTLTDDRGLTPMDFAKTRKMKKKLQEAWAEVANNKSTTNLGPIRAASREDLRTSIEDLTKRRKGEVIFDGVPNNPWTDASKKDAIARNKGITRHLSLKEKAGRGEDDGGAFTPSHVKDGVRRLGQVRNQKPSPLPRTKSRSTERLPAISPDRSSDRNSESPVPFSRNSRNRRSFEDKKQGMASRGRRMAPLSTREGSNVTDEYFDRLTPGPPSPTFSVHHKRSESDPNRGTPNLLEIAASCEPYLQPGVRRGRSYSVTSNPANDKNPDSNRHTPIQREGTVMSVQREATLMSICSYRTDSRMSTNATSPRLLNLGQMLCQKSKTPVQNMPLYGPGSNKVIPPTPTFMTQGRRYSGRDSESDTSPRSDDDMSEVFRDNPLELLRSRTIFKEEFILEDSRPKDPFFHSSSGSGSDTVSSSGSSHLSSPRDTPLSSRHGKLNSLNVQNGQGTSANIGAKNIVTSMNITKPNINEKCTPTAKKSNGCLSSNSSSKVLNGGNPSQASKGDKSLQCSKGGNPSQASKGDKSLQSSKGGISNGGANGNTKDISVMHATAMRNAAMINASKTTTAATSKPGAKAGGTILVHNDSEGVIQMNEVPVPQANVKRGEKSDTNKNVKNVQKGTAISEKVESKSERNDSNSKAGSNSKNTSEKTDIEVTAKENKTGLTQSNAKKNVSQKQKSNVLQVVPTKLTENIIQSAIKVGKDRDEKSENVAVKTLSGGNVVNEANTEKGDKTNTSETVHLNNVNMQLSASARFVNRVTGQSNNASKTEGKSALGDKQAAEIANKTAKLNTQSKLENAPETNKSVPSNIKTENKSNDTSKTPAQTGNKLSQSVNKQQNQSQSVNQTVNQTANKSLNQSNTNRTVSQSNSAQMNNRQGALSRNANANMNVSRSAGDVQRTSRNMKKPTSSYTPRFQSSSSQNSNSSKTDTDNKSDSKLPTNSSTSNTSVRTNSSSDNKSSSNQTNASTKLQTKNIQTGNQSTNSDSKPVKTNSPTELVGPSVCRSGSMSKSYNMASVPTISKASSNLSSGSSNSDNSVAAKTTVSDSSQNPKTCEARKNSVISKSTSESLSGSAKVSTSGIVSKSHSQMPSVGTVQEDKSNKILLRSSSMSTIEEAKEKQLMSSSDTKIECKKSSKQRPSSDGPVGATSGHGNTPLVEIIPDCAPRINRVNYMEANAVHTTPVIVNPFEELEKKREKENMQKLGRSVTATEFGFVVEKPTTERSKTQTSLKCRNVKSAKKATSSNTRVSSGKRKRVRSKDPSKSDTENACPKSGKSGKRVRSGRRKKKASDNSLSEQNEKPDVALIGGIGWQLATSCLDKTDVDAIVVSQIDSSESDSEDVDVVRVPAPLRLEIPHSIHLQIPNLVETPTSASTPRFREVLPTFENKPDLPFMENDGFPPMNLDMQNSNPHLNRSGVIIDRNIPGDISDFLAQLKDEDNSEFDDIVDDSSDEDYDSEEYSENYHESNDALHQQFIMGKLTPIPESPAQTRTSSSLTHVARTVNAISKFDTDMKDEDLNKLLGVTPRDKNSSYRDYSSIKAEKGSSGSSNTRTNSLRNSGGSLRSAPSHKDTKPVNNTNSSANSRSQILSRGTSSKTNPSARSSGGDTKDSSSSGTSKQQNVPQARSAENGSRNNSVRKSGSSEGIKSRRDKVSEKYEVEKQKAAAEVPEMKQSVRTSKSEQTVNETKGDNAKKVDLKQLLAEKMQSTQKMLDETAAYNSMKNRSESGKRRSSDGSDKVTVKNLESSSKSEMTINVRDLEEDTIVINLETTNRGSETGRTDDDVKSTRSSRRERRYSETKNHIQERDDDITEAIDEIMSNTFPSFRSNMKSGSFKSASSTLTEADRKVLMKMSEDNKESPFHAKGSVRASSSYDDVTLNRDNPELMHKFHADKFQMGQKIKAMLESGANTAKVKAMVISDNESKQLARIMNSFKQMELYAGPHSANNRSSKKETPRRDGEFRSDNISHQALSGRPGSAGAGRIRTGKFTEIKEKSHNDSRPHSPTTVPTNLAAEIKRSPYVQVASRRGSEHFEELANAVRADSPDDGTLTDNFSLDEDHMERADSACTTLSSHSSIMEETIQWKKGNVLGKGAFGTVWCGLTSEGQLIAVKQIELNTNNKYKATKEYEKVQEEVELLKTLEHKNIVGYLGTSLEDSTVSIFMQFVPGGSIASILARFGALDEAVFRKYTRQVLEGVEYLHENDVIHRDIKGGNVMLMPNGVIKLIDFGCAKRLCINLSMDQSEILKSMKGTPFWMAPEVVNETGHGKKSDIWSIGCTVFEMATRKPPWADMNPMAAIFAIGSDKPIPQLPDRFSDEARDFINSCLCRDQLRRMSATELLRTPFIKKRGKKSSSSNY